MVLITTECRRSSFKCGSVKAGVEHGRGPPGTVASDALASCPRNGAYSALSLHPRPRIRLITDLVREHFDVQATKAEVYIDRGFSLSRGVSPLVATDDPVPTVFKIRLESPSHQDVI